VKVFLDIGANTGQTAQAVVDPRYSFDRIVCFEPAPSCWDALDGIADERVSVERVGLSNRTGRATLYRPGRLDGTVEPEMDGVGESTESATVSLVRASDWFAENVRHGNIVFAKLNCEGSECDIVEDLLDSGELAKCYSVMIDFDIRKVPGLRSRELAVRDRLRASGHNNVSFAEDVMIGDTHADRIHHWLDAVGAHESLALPDLRAKYAETLTWLATRRGRAARLEAVLQRKVLAKLPPGLGEASRRLWRVVRGAVRGRAQRRLSDLNAAGESDRRGASEPSSG
jgi:FkbM family methyltransferase